MESLRFRDDDSDFFFNNNNDKPRISRHNTMSRRFFPSSNFTISSTASSPGYFFKDEIIDPSTYCFSTALKALQARSGCQAWECSSPASSEGFALNSKWDEAEKYICNPLSGKVPLECLSSKSLFTAKSFRYYPSSSNRITMSAPLVFSSSSNNKPFSSSSEQDLTLQLPIIPISEKKEEGRTRDVGTQSTPPYVSSSSSSPSAASTPSIMERSTKRVADSSSSPVSNSKTKSEEDDDQVEEEKGKEREETTTETAVVTDTTHDSRDEENNKEEQVCRKRRQQQGCGCFSWTCMMTTRFLIRNNHKIDKPRKYLNNVFPTNHHFKSC